MNLREKWIQPGGDTSDAFEVRMDVFVDEQGFSPEIEIDGIDPVAYHVVLYDAQRPVACARVYEDGESLGTYVAGRVCVRRELRGWHIGARLMELLERKAAELGAKEVVLGAQRQAEGFYAGCGYTPYGAEYMEEHCPHIHMKKKIQA